MEHKSCQLLILGGGPGGYSCALQAADLGLDVVLVEPEDLGGTCLHAGCIPSKAIIHVAQHYHQSTADPHMRDIGLQTQGVSLDWPRAQQWKDALIARLAKGVQGLLQTAQVQVVKGYGELQDGKRCWVRSSPAGEVEVEYTTEHLVISVGAQEIEIPGFSPSADVLYAESALELPQLPKSMLVVGAGYIGVELGQAFARLGVQVTIAESAANILPLWDAELTRPLHKQLAAEGISLRLQSKAIEFIDGRVVLETDTGERETLSCEKVLVAVGRKPRLTGWGLRNVPLDLLDGRLQVNAQCRTSMSGVYAIGDVTGGPMLAHRAIAQGRIVAERIVSKRHQFDPAAIPAVCFSQPEIVSVGLTPSEAKEQFPPDEVMVSRLPFAGNGRALTLGDGVGFVRVVVQREGQVVLGVQAVGRQVAELAHGFTVALEMGACLEDIALMALAHPTLGESFAEAAHAAMGVASLGD